MVWSSSPISALCMLHHRRSQQGIQTDSWEICAGVQIDHDERKNTYYSENTLYRESTGLGNYTNLYAKCHADSSASDFPLHAYTIWRQNLLSNVTCHNSKIYSKINNVITSMKMNRIRKLRYMKESREGNAFLRRRREGNVSPVVM